MYNLEKEIERFGKSILGSVYEVISDRSLTFEQKVEACRDLEDFYESFNLTHVRKGTFYEDKK